ncbi:uncharacterized protein [Brachionichthys hirsutus]|uniref:uncharacterized protein n=1 Tax=Brachionichthys hirsutus TaxID=412623 RepID=UPI003604D573
MGRLAGLGWLFLLTTLANTEPQKRPSIKISSKCLGNVMRVDVGPLGGRPLEVAAVLNNSSTLLTPGLASRCGFSMKVDWPGNAKIYASLQNCFAENTGHEVFTTALLLRLPGSRASEDELFEVAETCRYAAWASREVVCDRSFMEVSLKRAAPGDCALPRLPVPEAGAESSPPLDDGSTIATLAFLTPAEETMKMMTVTEARRNGYGVATSAGRLLLRCPTASSETFIQHVAGVAMTVLNASILFQKMWLATRVEAAAACPRLEGSVSFTARTITWLLPRRVDPLVSGRSDLLEVHMGVDGGRLEPAEMAARRYSLSVSDAHVVLEIPVGAAGGYFKSHVRDGRYLTTYSIEPMLELLWTEDGSSEDTRYKVLLPITTPLLSGRLQVTDHTVPEERLFKVLFGPFVSDVVLVNVSFPSAVLSVSGCNARGFNVLERMSPDGSSKVFTLEVPFADGVVLQTEETGTTVYSLRLTFGLVVLPEYAPFSHAAHLEATLVGEVPPSVSGDCDDQNFYILVKHGSRGSNFEIVVGKRALTPGLARLYAVTENGTHSGFAVPFPSPDVAFEAIQGSSIKARLDVVLRSPESNGSIQQFSLSCNFLSALTECHPNGTMTALAVKLESVPSLSPSRLTLRDPACGPSSSDDRFAYFVFTGSSCGTTRKFLSTAMVYENEISLPDELQTESDEPEYELKVSCFYQINGTRAVSFRPRHGRSDPVAGNGKGKLQVTMRLALDGSYSAFHSAEDYPVATVLRQPLHFEVELKSGNPRVSLELEKCWATFGEDGASRPRWNLIINGCVNPVDLYQVALHPVEVDARVQLPSHFRRFEVRMVALAEGRDDPRHQLRIHCEVVICDDRNRMGGACRKDCSNQESPMKGRRRAAPDGHTFRFVSSGAMMIK